MKTYLEPTEITLLEQAANSLRDRLLIRLLFHLGCRVTEVLSLTEDDIDFDGNTVAIKHLKTRLKLSCPKCGACLGRRHVFCSGCGDKVFATVAKEVAHRRQRVIPIDNRTLDLLKEYIKRGGAH